MVAEIEVISKELIKPSSPTPHYCKDHKLSFVDQCQLPIYLPLIFFYRNQFGSNIIDQSKRSQRLKQSLADALTKFYHLAGRIRGNVSIDCNDSGALFVEAQVHASLSQATQNAPIDELNQYLPSSVTNTDDAPLLAIQISFFGCRGAAIGVCISHKVADVASLVMFMNYWAVLSRGENIEDSLQHPSCDLAFQLFPGVDEDSPFPNVDGNWGKEKLASKRFLFDREKLAELKELASSDDFLDLQVKNPTGVEAVSAFIWKQFIDVSRAKGDNKSMFLTSHAVNLRPRMKSISPYDQNVIDNLFGNLSIRAHASLMSWVFGNRYQELVWILRTSIRRIDQDFIKIVQSGVPYLNFLKNAGRLFLPNLQEMEFCCFSSLCRFPMYEADFGWGKPLTVCISAVPVKNMVVLMSTRSADGIEAWITMLEGEMAMLSDEFLSLETTTYY